MEMVERMEEGLLKMGFRLLEGEGLRRTKLAEKRKERLGEKRFYLILLDLNLHILFLGAQKNYTKKTENSF